jgi:hypothetical protein
MFDWEPMAHRSGKSKEHRTLPESPYPAYPGTWHRHLLLVLVFVGATCLVYARTLGLGFFHLDDPGYVTDNPWIRGFTAANLRHILTTPYFANYSPVHLLSYLIDHAIGSLNPWFFHLSSMLWAGATAGFVYLLTVGLTGRRLIGIAAGALFVVHPVHVETIVWVSSRKDLVAAAFALPAVLTWLEYRKRGRQGRAWYVASVIFFILAVAGKLSVVVLPAILLAFDYFFEKRRGLNMLLDKIPFAVVTLLFALPTIGAQPPTRQSLHLFELGYVFSQCLWLLTGFGDYVLYRVPPRAMQSISVIYAALSAGILVLPFLMRRYIPGLALALFCWIVLSLIPSQVLGFIHPVADRYIYFPSIGIVILLAWGVPAATERVMMARWKKAGRLVAIGVLVAVTLVWLRSTHAYVREWNDPRSVWYGATAKSDDGYVYQYLGTHYQDAADSLANRLNAAGRRRETNYRLAELVWESDERLNDLLDEWDGEDYEGPMSQAFRRHLREMAWHELERAVERKGTLLRPNLFFRRGKLQVDLGDLESARHEFQQAYEQSRLHTYEGVHQELAVRCHYALGVVAWRLGDHDEALRMMALARDEQTRAGKIWAPDLDAYIERLKTLAGRAGTQ